MRFLSDPFFTVARPIESAVRKRWKTGGLPCRLNHRLLVFTFAPPPEGGGPCVH